MFDELSIDAVTGAEIMNLLNVQPHLLKDPIILHRLRDVMAYLKDQPDISFIINRITMGKNVDKLDHVWGYIELLKKKEIIQKDISNVEKEVNSFSDKERLGSLSDLERSLAMDVIRKKENLVSEVSKISTELSFYEK